MRELLLKLVEKIYIGLLPRDIKATSHQIVPVTRSVAYKSGMRMEQVQRHLVRDLMTDNLMPYVEFSTEQKETGITLLTARVDVIQRHEIEGVKVDEKQDN